MRIDFLGTGSWAPQADRTGPCLLIGHEGRNILIDCGEGSLRRLISTSVGPDEIDAVFLTHLHPDHLSGLLPFFFYQRITSQRKEPVLISGPTGLEEFLNALPACGDPDLFKRNLKIDRLEFEPPFSFDFGCFRLTARRTMHKAVSVGYRIEAGSKVIAVSGDTGYCDEVVALSRSADLLICEAGTEKPREGHLTPTEAGIVARMARVNALALVHLPPDAHKETFRTLCEKEFGAPVSIPDDLSSIEL